MLVAAGRLVKIVRSAGNGGTGNASDGLSMETTPVSSSEVTEATTSSVTSASAATASTAQFRMRKGQGLRLGKVTSIVSTIRASHWLDRIEVNSPFSYRPCPFSYSTLFYSTKHSPYSSLLHSVQFCSTLLFALLCSTTGFSQTTTHSPSHHQQPPSLSDHQLDADDARRVAKAVARKLFQERRGLALLAGHLALVMVQQASGRYRHTIATLANDLSGSSGGGSSNSGSSSGGSGSGSGSGSSSSGNGFGRDTSTIDATTVDKTIQENNESFRSSAPQSKPNFEDKNHGRRWSDDGYTEYEGWVGVVGVGGGSGSGGGGSGSGGGGGRGGRGGRDVLDSAREMLDSMPNE